MEIITGKTGTDHVKAEDDRALHKAIFGSGNYVIDTGSKFAPTIDTSNSITISDGELMMEGCHARIRYGEAESVAIENGTTGYNRIDVIAARYTKQLDVEGMSLVVIKGEAVTGTPSQPAHTEGSILEGDEVVDMPLFAVRLKGTNIENVTAIYESVLTIDKALEMLAEADSDLALALTQQNTSLTNKINSVNTSLTNKINSVNTSLTNSISTVKSDLQKEIGSAEVSANEYTDGRIDELNEALDETEATVQDLRNAVKGTYQTVGVDELTLTSSEAVAAGAYVDVTKALTTTHSGATYSIIPIKFGNCKPSATSISSGKLTARLVNDSGASHTLSCTFLIVAREQITSIS